MLGLSAGEAAEWSCALAGPAIGKIIHLLNRLDEVESYPSSLREFHVQGGEHVPQAVTRAELLEYLDGYPPVLMGLAKTFRVVFGEKERYTLGINDGFYGESLRKRLKLSLKKHKECRVWLLRVTEALMKKNTHA